MHTATIHKKGAFITNEKNKRLIAVPSFADLWILFRACNGKASTVWLNGEQIHFSNSAPIVEKGVILVPIRPLLKKLGAKVN
nr:hypothetical protein [Paenibacillus sp. Y412MC10]